MANEKPIEIRVTDPLTDEQLKLKGYATGPDVEATIEKCYGSWLGSREIARSQLASLKRAWRAEFLQELEERIQFRAS
jgi:hypothetical protein